MILFLGQSGKANNQFERIIDYSNHHSKLFIVVVICFLITYCVFLNFSLAIKNAEDNGPTKKDPASSDLLCDGEQ